MSQIYKPLSATPPPPGFVETLTGNSGGAVGPDASDNINVIGDGTTVNVVGTPGTNTLTISAINAGFTWVEKSTVDSPYSIPIETGVFCNDTMTVVLPAAGPLLIGNTVIIYVDTANTVTIQAATGERIQIGDEISILAGTATSNARGSVVELTFKASDVTWHTISSLGSWSVQTS